MTRIPFITALLSLTSALAVSGLSWVTLTPEQPCTKRHEASAASVDGILYLLGGRRKMNVEAYDPAANTWTKKAMVPMELHHFAAVTVGQKIAILGALTGGYPKETPVPHLWWYEPATDQWTQGPEIPEGRRRGAAGCVLSEDKLYLVGGNTDGHWSGFVPWLDCLDLKTGTWTQLPDAPHARDHFQAALVDGKIIAAGGRRTHAAEKHVFDLTVAEVDLYDIAKGTWSTMQKPIPTPRAGAPTITHRGRVIVAGGESNRPGAHAEVESLNPITGEWLSLPNMNQGRHSGGAALIGDDLYFAAGCSAKGGGKEETTLERLSLPPLQSK